jgi:multidrug resistance efflux pump
VNAGLPRPLDHALPGGVRELSALELIAALQRLRHAPTADEAGRRAVWAELTSGVMRLTRARAAWLLDGGHLLACAGEVAASPAASDTPSMAGDAALAGEPWAAELPALLARAATQGFATMPARNRAGASLWLAAVRQSRLPAGWMLLAIPDSERPQLNELLLRAQLVADLPTHGSTAAEAPPAPPAPPQAQDALAEVGAQLARQTQFGAAAIALVNTLAQVLGAEQVLLAWRGAAGSLATVAISHRERFDRFAHPVVLSEDALEETLHHDGGVLVVAGTAPEHLVQTPAHGLLLEELGARHLLTLPLARHDGAPVAALLLVFDGEQAPPEPAAVARLQQALAAQLPWLQTLQQQAQPWPARLLARTREHAARWLGPGRLGLKLSSVLLALALLYSVFANWEYRVSAGAQLATDSMRVLGAMFDGRVEEARVTAGDSVSEGQLLARLDTRELRQQESDAAAELKRHVAEADKARAAGALADLEVSTARAAQAQSRLARVGEQITQAEARAPFAGVVVEGARQELQGAPVRKGDKLYRVARVEGLYATLQVGERDAARVKLGATGELVLLARPEERMALKVVSVVPVAQTKGTEGNHFLVRAEITGTPAAWWRPGMSGNARIDAGSEPVIWILTHRIVDTMRLWLWW